MINWARTGTFIHNVDLNIAGGSGDHGARIWGAVQALSHSAVASVVGVATRPRVVARCGRVAGMTDYRAKVVLDFGSRL